MQLVPFFLLIRSGQLARSDCTKPDTAPHRSGFTGVTEDEIRAWSAGDSRAPCSSQGRQPRRARACGGRPTRAGRSEKKSNPGLLHRACPRLSLAVKQILAGSVPETPV